MEADTIIQGDALDELDSIPEESVHAIVTDPPYGLNFMGKDWDNFRRRNNEDDVGRDSVHGRMSASAPASGAETDMHRYQEWCRRWAEKALRVLRPGGHLLAFSGNRTHHRLFCGVEDAGFEVRDTLTWHYGTGFPKGRGVETDIPWPQPDPEMYSFHSGWKTQLKPSTEFIVLARKPVPGTVAECVREYGTGALNIDATRIGDGERTLRGGSAATGVDYGEYGEVGDREVSGRYPANLLLDAEAARRMDAEVGELSGGSELRTNDEIDSGDGEGVNEGYQRPNASMFTDDAPGGIRQYGDKGGPSRYFYTSKATTAERTLDGQIQNKHPTVKPLDLMEWLVKLATRRGQTVLDPFTGTGTTCRAARDLDRRFIGIERQEKWADVARVRCGLAPVDPSNVRKDDAQLGVRDF